jgi:predicted ATPase/DNA-binding winged helix-turn-helix (wHTH) protein
MTPDEACWRFGSFVVWEAQRRVERAGQAVRLGARSFDLLLGLLKQAGELVSKDELLASVWTGLVVEETSVRVHMSLLRKALGEPGESDGCKEWITTIPLRGYRFNGRVVRELPGDSPNVTTSPAGSFTKLPVALTELVGRDADIANVLESLDAHRLVTLVGPGGIGKTSVASSAAGRYRPQPATEVVFVDLAPLISPDHVLGTIARSLGVAADLPDPVDVITQQLTGTDVLVLIDNCEHVLDSLASPITRLLAALPCLHILATSREPLRVSGEYVLRLSPLAVPDAEHITLEQALGWPSVRLLVERAKAAGRGSFNESDGPLLARLSQQLDGIPLAIELVAARLGVQSIGDLALRLDDHMRLLSIGNRAALARHRSLAAALDWSIKLLSGDELRTFRRLSLFRGRFDVESALAMVAFDMDADVAFDALISLANKSLVVFDGSDDIAPYHLLDTTRSYAAALLAESDERPVLLRRYKLLMLDLLKAATADLPHVTRQAWYDHYTRHLNDVRFALQLCLAEQADAKTAAALIAASASLWILVSQVAEYRDQVTAVLALVDRQPEPDPETTAGLLTALIVTLLHTDVSNPALGAICDRAVNAALAVKSHVPELQARWGGCVHEVFRGEYAAAQRHAVKMLGVAQRLGDRAALNLAYRANAMADHFCGQFATARRHGEAALDISRDLPRTPTTMVGVEPSVAALAVLVRTLWIQGESEKALETARQALELAESTRHAVSLCAALYGACPVALWSGEFELADKWIRIMMDETHRRGLVGWGRYAEWYVQGLQLSRANETGAHVREVFEQLSTYDTPHKEMLVTFCTDWVDDAMVTRVVSGEGLWSAAEVWRAIGKRSEQRGMTDEAEALYLRALDTSRRQGAKAWEQRATLSLTRMWSGLGRSQEAAQLLDKIFGHTVAPGNGNPAFLQARELRKEIALRTKGSPRKVAKNPHTDNG